MRLKINKIEVEASLRELAEANGVTVSQMATFIFSNFYTSVRKMEVAKKIRRHSVAITNLTEELL